MRRILCKMLYSLQRWKDFAIENLENGLLCVKKTKNLVASVFRVIVQCCNIKTIGTKCSHLVTVFKIGKQLMSLTYVDVL